MNMNKLIEKSNELGWIVQDVSKNSYNFSKFSPAGQDFNMLIVGKNPTELIQRLYEEFNQYDESSEAYLWLDSTGHGRNGAPYHMRDVLDDMAACKEMIHELFITLKKELDEDESK